MTFLQVSFDYEGTIRERDARSLDGIREVYGIWAISIDERSHRITIQYDASRLTRSDLAFMLRNAGIQIAEPGLQAA
jgi:hypothetical protein